MPALHPTRKKPRLVLTLGDPAGIGPEVILKAVCCPALPSLAQILVVGSVAALEETRRKLKLRLGFGEAGHGGLFAPGRIQVLDPAPFRGWPPRPGRWTAATGRASLAYAETAIDLCLRGEADGLVTGPICKAAWRAAGCPYPGHTELLAARTRTRKVVMLLVGGGLRVALATIHEPLAQVPRLVTRRGIVETCQVLDRDLRRFFGLRRPRIAVLGLNPHAGEEGQIGREEKRVLAPAVAALRRQGIAAIGPVPADTAFHQALCGAYDAVLAMYHDQGLGPLKTVAFDTGVNVTLGLPIVRTSVDHGTAFGIAGKGLASAASCVEAIRLAARMAGRSTAAKRGPA